MSIHKIEHQNRNGILAILKCRNGYLKAFCQHLPEAYGDTFDCGELIEVQLEKSGNWCATGVFENAIIAIDPIRWYVSLEEASEDHRQDAGLMWLDLARAGLMNAFDANALREGFVALQRLEEAKAVYRDTMEGLGFQEYDEGCYEDYQDWLALPGLPMVKFPLES